MSFDYSGVQSVIANEMWSWKQPSNKGKVIEYELRIGTYKNKFIPGVTRNEYYRIMNYFSHNFPLNKEVPSRETVEYFGEGVRRVTRENGTLDMIRKKPLTGATPSYGSDFGLGEWTIRQSLAEEIKISSIPENAIPQLVKERLSTSFIFPLYRLDMRETLPLGPYEVEIEYFENSWEKTERDVSVFLEPLSTVLSLLTSSRVALSTQDKLRVMNSYHWNWGMRDQRAVHFPIKKPINLRRSTLDKIKDGAMAVLPKIDGVRYFLYFGPTAVYAINYTNFMIYEKKSFPEMRGRILDGEIYKGLFYAFDAVFDKEQVSVTNLSFKERYRVIEKTAREFARVVPVPYHTNLLQGLVEISTDSRYDLDGIIFTPLAEKYTGTNYKFKPIELLTIDFLTQKIEERTYRLLSGNARERRSETFKGTSAIPFEGTIKVDEEGEEIIEGQEAVFEFKWNGLTFYPYRQRYDKLFPNDINVAKEIWEEIHEPVLIKDLVMSLSKTPNMPSEIDLNLIITGLGGRPEIPIVIEEKKEEEFDFDKLKWEKDEIIKRINLMGRSVIVNKDGSIVWDDDDGELRVTFWRDYISGNYPLEKEEKIPEFSLPGFSGSAEKVFEKFEKVEIEGKTYDLKRFKGDYAIIDAILYIGLPSFREKSKKERGEFVSRLKKSFDREYRLFFHKISPEVSKKFSDVFGQVYHTLEKDPAEVIKVERVSLGLAKVLKKIIDDPARSILEMMSKLVPLEKLESIIVSAKTPKDITMMVRKEVRKVFASIPGCVPEEKEKYLEKKIVEMTKKVLYQIMEREDVGDISVGEFLLTKLQISLLTVQSSGMEMVGESKYPAYVTYGDETDNVGVVGEVRQKVFYPVLASSLNVDISSESEKS